MKWETFNCQKKILLCCLCMALVNMIHVRIMCILGCHKGCTSKEIGHYSVLSITIVNRKITFVYSLHVFTVNQLNLACNEIWLIWCVDKNLIGSYKGNPLISLKNCKSAKLYSGQIELIYSMIIKILMQHSTPSIITLI